MNPTLRRIAALRPLRAVLSSSSVEPLVAGLLRASPVRGRARFLTRELRPPTEPCAYRLRESGAVVHLRHGTPDVAALGEVFYERQYEPPPSVMAILDGLGRPPELLDLGANIGLFGVFAAARFPASRLVAFEPDPANIRLLRRTMEANGLSWKIVEAAAATAEGEVPFRSGEFTVSRIDETGEPVRAVDVLPYLTRADLAKIDIEGGEWAILADPRFPAVAPRALALEYHPHLAPPGADAESALGAIGYAVERALRFGERHGLVWAVRDRD